MNIELGVRSLQHVSCGYTREHRVERLMREAARGRPESITMILRWLRTRTFRRHPRNGECGICRSRSITSLLLSQLEYLQAKGVKFDRRIDHGMTHSLYLHDPNGYGVELVYDLPREIWENDIDAALNFAELRPHEGADPLIDRTDVPVFGAPSRSSN
jgi:hypothetical protein